MNLKKLAATAVVYSLAIAVSGCASAPKRTKSAESSMGANAQNEALEEARSRNTPDAREYEAMDADYRKKNYDAVVKRGTNFVKAHRSSPFLDDAYNLKGLAYIGLKQYQFALFQLKKAVEVSDNDNLKNMASYNLAYVYFELGQVDQAAHALEALRPSSLERTDRYKYHVLRAKIDRLRHDYPGSAFDLLSALKYVPEPRSAATVDPMFNFLDEVLEPITNISQLERLLDEFEDSPAADRLLYKIATHYIANGERDRAMDYFKRIVDKHPDSRHYAIAKDNLRKQEFQGVVDAKRIGVVLTLSGKFGKFGYKALQGIELALKIFQPTGEPAPVTLVVMDDQGEPDRALAAMEELYFKHHVVGIIGPLVSKLAEPMGKKAQELGVPLIALSQKEAVGGDYVFNAALTPAIQVRELVRYASERAGIKNFAVLSPSSKFGEEYANAFWDEVDRVNGSIRGYETYAEEETDFRTYIDKIVGLAQTDARAHEVEELKLLKAATPVKSRSKKFDRMFDLKPIVDFEAVFIPDEPKVLGQVLPTFAYRDVEKILFLGINTWNSQELIARAGKFAEGAVFVDGFYAGSENPAAKKFLEEYRATFNMDPTLVEALAYDAAQVVATLVRDRGASSRRELRDKIMGLRDFPGVAGKISYQEGRLTKRLQFLTVKNGRIEEVAFQ